MKKLFVLFSAALCGFSLWAASGGSESSAVSIKAEPTEAFKTVKLVPGKDWDEGSYVYYLKMTLKKNKGYTVWFEGGDAAEIGLEGLDVYAYEPGWDDDWGDDGWDDDFDDDWGGDDPEPPSAWFSESAVQAGNYVTWLDADDWEKEDPSSWTYYIQLSATNAYSTTVHVQEGRRSFLPPGMAENPEQITMTETEQKKEHKTTEEGAYYFTTTLEAGRKYLVRTTGGTSACPFGLNTLAFSNFNDEVDPDYPDPYNAAYAIYPLEGGVFKFVVTCSDTNVPFASTTNVPFGFCYRAVPKREIDKHPLKATVSDGGSVSFTPGRIVAGLDYYDDIIDECLFKIDGVRKGERWVFDSKGAVTNCEMRLYDSKGNILATNGTIGNRSFDMRIGLDAEADGPYYVGVCDPALGQRDASAGGTESVFTARKVEANDGETVDIAPLPAPGSADPVSSGSSDGPFELSDTCWSQTFRFGARKNQGFALATSLVDKDSNLDLLAEVFRLSGSTEKPVELISGKYLTPGNVIGFAAPASGEYYVRVSVAQGKGLDFPKFKIHAIGYENGVSSLGVLTVVTKGADGLWTLDKDSTKYSGGISLIVASGEHTVKFASVKGFNIVARGPDGVGTKGSWSGTVAAGKSPTVVTGEYSDTYDPKDDVKKGAASLKVSAKETENGRTLWKADGADWFKFSAKDGVYYNFAIDRIEGDATMTVYDANEMAVPDLFGVQKVVKQPLAKGTYYIKVFHANSPAEDGAYTLRASSAQVGSIKFGKTAIKATDATGKVTLTVKRTAKEGKVRVRYVTVDGTAKAGDDFIYQTGVLAWDANDKKDKTIVVKLIPPLVPVAKGTSKEFSVVLSALDETEIAEDEYPAQVIGGPATITISGTAKPGVDPYAVKKATGKEVADSWTGTFSGVLTNGTETGTDRIASVTLTAKANGSMSAKVIVGGSTFSLSAKNWEGTTEYRVATLTSKKADAKLVLFADGSAELTFVGDDAAYAGVLVRNNSKVQAYLDKIVNYAGYYTVSLVPGGESGVPGGCGYLTLTLDNKGAVKVAGLLGDGTKVSGKSVASIRDDGSLLVPVFAAKGVYCFGGTLKVDLVARACDGRKVPCVDSSCKLVWNKEGSWEAEVSPVGGYYDTVINLQAYYNGLKLSMDRIPVEVDSNALVVEKNAEGENISGVTFSFTRKTGLVKGKLSYHGGKSVAYNGVMLLTTDEKKQDVVGRAFFISNSVSYPLSIVVGEGDALTGFVGLW